MDVGKILRFGTFLASDAIKDKANDVRTTSANANHRALADLAHDGTSLFQAYMWFCGFFGCAVFLTIITHFYATDVNSYNTFVESMRMSPENSQYIFSFHGGFISLDILRILISIIIFPFFAAAVSLFFGGLGALILYKLAFQMMAESIRGASLFVRIIVGFVMVIMGIFMLDLLPMTLAGVVMSLKMMWVLSNLTYGGFCYFGMLLITLMVLVVLIFDILNFMFALLFGLKLSDLI